MSVLMTGGAALHLATRLRVVGVAAVLFGILTILSGGLVHFGGAEARSAAGAIVSFVLWFNFTAGFFYVLAGAGLFLHRRWAAVLSAVIAAATLFVFLAFGLHVLTGGDFEFRTVGAMIFRSAVWISIAAYVWRRLYMRAESDLSP
ncbi:MAG: hypothetical protein ABJN26_24785 [Stappiaceae bacterium]